MHNMLPGEGAVGLEARLTRSGRQTKQLNASSRRMPPMSAWLAACNACWCIACAPLPARVLVHSSFPAWPSPRLAGLDLVQRFLQLRQQQQQGMQQPQTGMQQLPPGVQQHTNPLALLRQQAVLRRQEQEGAFQGPRPSTAGSGRSSGDSHTGRGQATGLATAAAAAATGAAADEAAAASSASGRISARSSPQRLAAAQLLSQGRGEGGPGAAFTATFTNPLALERADSDCAGAAEQDAAAAAAVTAAAAAGVDGGALEQSPFEAAAQPGWSGAGMEPAGGLRTVGSFGGRSGGAGLGERPAGVGGRIGGFRRDPALAGSSLSTATSLAAQHAVGSLSTATSLAAPHAAHAAAGLSPAASLASPHAGSRLAAAEAPQPPAQPLVAHPHRLSPSRVGSAAAPLAPASSATDLAGAAASDGGEALAEFAAAHGALPNLPASPGREQHSRLSQHPAARPACTAMPWDTVSRFEGQAEAAAEATATPQLPSASSAPGQDSQLAGTAMPAGTRPHHRGRDAGGRDVAHAAGRTGSPQEGEQQMPPVELRPPAEPR